MIAVVEGNPNSIFRTGEEKALANVIFANRVDGAEIRQPRCDQLPGFAAVVRAVDIWMKIVDAETAYRSVGGLFIEVRCGNLRHLAPCGQFFGRDVGPVSRHRRAWSKSGRHPFRPTEYSSF